MKTTVGRTRPRMGAAIMALMLRTLVERACSVEMLVEITGLQHETVRNWLGALKTKKLVFIEQLAYRVDSRGRSSRRIRHYRWGPGKPDVKVTYKSAAQRAREWRESKGIKPRRSSAAIVDVSQFNHDQTGVQGQQRGGRIVHRIK